MVTERRWLLATTLLLALLVIFPGGGVASAQEPEAAPSFSLKPVTYNPDTPQGASYFALDAWPGETIKTEVMVTNTGETDGVAQLYAVDATTGQTSGVVYHQKHVAPEHVGTWVALDDTELALAPGEERKVTFTLAVPEDARPGHHLGGIVVVPVASAEGTPAASSEDGETSMQVHLELRMAIAVQVTVPGAEDAEMQITGLAPGGSDGYQTLNIDMGNTGNTMLKPRGEVVVRNDGGDIVQDLAFQLDTFLPGTAIDYATYIEGEALGVGSYEAAATLYYGDGQEAIYTQTFTIEEADIEEVFHAREPLAPPAADSGESGLLGAGSSTTMVALMGLAVALVGMLGIVGGRSFLHSDVLKGWKATSGEDKIE